jgi:hypothetical protein
MNQQFILNTPTRRLPAEVPETPIRATQASTQFWDSKNAPRLADLTRLNIRNE